jgi:hypothetical protein
MSIQLRGNTGTIAEVDANTRALRVTQRSDVLGEYGISLVSGTMAAGLAAGSGRVESRRSLPASAASSS